MSDSCDKNILRKFKFLRQPVECWTRVMGYFRPVTSYNPGKISEFNHRKWFKEEKIRSISENHEFQKK